jgi:hypothetical protein
VTRGPREAMLQPMDLSTSCLRALVGSTALAMLGGIGACQQQAAAPPLVFSGGHLGGGGGVQDASSSDGFVVADGVTTLTTGVVSPQAIALGPSSVYWTTAEVAGGGALIGDASTGTGGIESVPRTGGDRSEVIAGLANPGALALSDVTLFFAQGESEAGALDSFLLNGTTITPVATHQSPPLPMAIASGSLYWVGGTGTTLETESVSVSGGGVAVLDSYAGDFNPLAVQTDGQTVYVLTKGSDGASIFKLPASGGAPTRLWHDTTLTPSDMALAGTALYWLVNGSAEAGEILTMSVSGGSPVTLVTGLDNPAKLAVLDGTIYLTSDVAAGSILSVSTGGGAITSLATGLDYPFALAVDDAVYFTTASTVGRVAK